MPIALIPRLKTRTEAIPSRGSLPGVFVLVLVLAASLALACAGSKRAPSLRSPLPPRSAQAIDVQLEFDAAADLDLHVTDPGLETVYFGNSPSRSGGVLDHDVRCGEVSEGADATRRETVRFDDPAPGRYRVGVDHVKSCRRFRREGHYTLRVVGPDFELEKSGRISPGRFENAALEFDWPPSAQREREPD